MTRKFHAHVTSARAIITKGQITQTIVQFVYAPPAEVKELAAMQARDLHTLPSPATTTSRLTV